MRHSACGSTTRGFTTRYNLVRFDLDTGSEVNLTGDLDESLNKVPQAWVSDVRIDDLLP